jgi:hypothetical protein
MAQYCLDISPLGIGYCKKIKNVSERHAFSYLEYDKKKGKIIIYSGMGAEE